jgi:hypothetical protein
MSDVLLEITGAALRALESSMGFMIVVAHLYSSKSLL